MSRLIVAILPVFAVLGCADPSSERDTAKDNSEREASKDNEEESRLVAFWLEHPTGPDIPILVTESYAVLLWWTKTFGAREKWTTCARQK